MKGNLYTLCFAAVLGTTCALLLTAASEFTRPFQEANKEAEERLNILLAFNVPLEEGISSSELIEVFEANVREEERDGKIFYIYSPLEADGAVEAVVIRFAGAGVWGAIKGFLALEPDMRTIRGLTFYEQEETPGLGGDIVLPQFRDRFVGKQIMNAEGVGGFNILGGGGKEAGINEVDGITGATMTCDKVEDILNKTIKSIVEERDENVGE